MAKPIVLPKENQRVEAFDKASRRWVRVLVTKVNAKSFQGKDTDFNIVKGLEQWREPANPGKSIKEFLSCNPSKPSDSLKESADSPLLPNQLEDSSGLEVAKITPTQEPSSSPTSVIPSTEMSETTTQNPEVQTASLADSPALELPALDSETGLNTKTVPSGGSSTESSTESDPNGLLSSNPKVSAIAVLDKSSVPLPKSGMWGNGSVYQQPTLARPTLESGFSWCPTLTTQSGTDTSRPAGQTKLEEWCRKNGLLQTSQVLSAEMMELLQGFPVGWTKCLSELNAPPQEESDRGTDLEAPSYPPVPPSLWSGLNTSTVAWKDPIDVILTKGTQIREKTDLTKIDEYAQKMRDGLWDYERDPKPVIFHHEGRFYAGDCHHRTLAAMQAGEDLLYEIRQGTHTDAVIYSCRAENNLYHGLPLSPKDNRKRILMFLETLEELTESDRASLLKTVPGISDRELALGNWSNRLIAKYLGLSENQSRTIANIQKEIKEEPKTEKISQKERGVNIDRVLNQLEDNIHLLSKDQAIALKDAIERRLIDLEIEN